MGKIKFINANVITPFKIIKNGSVTVEKGQITDINTCSRGNQGCGKDNSNCYKIIDLEGNYLSPGFIDIHTHGGGGYDFLDGTVEAYLGAAEMHARHGSTVIVPTTSTSTNDELKRTFEVFSIAKKENIKGSEMIGLHLEGPYFAMSQKGAQDPRFIRDPDLKEYREILSWTDDIIRWSAAPELEGALEFGRYLSNKKILPSIAHTDAIYEQTLEAFENGFTHVTHLYSSTSMVKRINAYRYAGVVEAAYLIDEMTVEIIADGSHLPASLLKLVYKIKGADRIALITDSMRAAGLPEGESILGSKEDGMPVIVEDGVAKLPDRSAFAGSVATADKLVRNMINLAGVPIEESIKMMTYTPATIVGINDKKGSIVLGKDGDLVVFDDDINIKLTMVKGNIIYNSL